MTTRSGSRFKAAEMSSGESAVADLIRVLLEDRQRQEDERARREERRQQETQEQLALERERQDARHQMQMEQMQEQLTMVRGWMERSQARDEHLGRAIQDPLKLTKLTETEDIESYLTTFERMMQVYHVDEERWAFKLAPQLTGRAQQAYAAMTTEDATNYQRVKAAILHRYNITEDTYRRRFRDARKQSGESFTEMVIRLYDLVKKWMASCETVEEVLDRMVVEQVVSTMSTDLRIWVTERKPESREVAGRLADSYIQARQNEGGRNDGRKKIAGPKSRDVTQQGTGDGNRDPKKCRSCGQEGHWAKYCPKKTEAQTTEGCHKGDPKSSPVVKMERVKCYNCQRFGHFAADCPEKGYFCGESGVGSVIRKGIVNGQTVEDIVLDTGCTRTMVHRKLVKEPQYVDGEAVTIRCAHGDTVLYPLADVEIILEEGPVKVKAAVAEKLPASVLLGTDVPQLGKLLLDKPVVEEALVVKTRAQTIKDKAEEQEHEAKQQECGVRPHPLEDQDGGSVIDVSDGIEMPGQSFADDLFRQDGRAKPRQTRKQKREERARHGVIRAKDLPQKAPTWNFGSKEELIELQRTDDTLETVRKEASGQTEAVDSGLFERDGVIYRRWIPAGGIPGQPIDQIVLPKNYRRKVLHIAHTIPLGGHLAKKRTARRVMKCFYWPTLFQDAGDFCKSCEECQKCTQRRGSRAPMIPMPLLTTPFERVAMDIIGPLPRSRSGNRYVLVMCDYGTRYPEAVPLKSIEAEKIAEELVAIFARVGIPKEILTDQGSNFTSQLLAELYRLLKVSAIRTSPYHPQTDGLVERFNQTLKEMLRKSAQEDGKDWDKLIPYVLFAYREVPQESTGYSPFELVYGREVRGPMDVLKESWESSERSDESVLSYILLMRERLAHMTELVQKNLSMAQTRQKNSYDRGTHERQFATGDQVLVLLPTTTSKLTARWQGPYEVVKPVGKVNYLVDLYDRRRRKRVLHVNMLKEWKTPTSSSYLALEELPEDEIPGWDDEGGEVHLGEDLTAGQKYELEQLVTEFTDVLSSIPGETRLTDHHIETGNARPVRLPPYRLPQAYRDSVQIELKKMLDHGIIEHSKSD